MARPRRRGPAARTAFGWSARLGELDDDAERLPGVEERLLPVRIGVVVADDVIALGPGARAGLTERRHPEGHVVDARTPVSKEAVEETVRAGGLEDLEPAASLEAPLPEAVHGRGSAVSGDAAEQAGQHGRRVGHALGRDGDVVEENSGHWTLLLVYTRLRWHEEVSYAREHGRQVPDAAGDREGRPTEPGARPLGLPGGRRRDRDHPQAEPPGARLDRLPAARAERRLED